MPGFIEYVKQLFTKNEDGRILQMIRQPKKAVMPPETKLATTYLRRAFCINGIRPPQTYRKQYFIAYFFIHSLISFYLPNGFILTYFVEFNKFDPNEFFTSLQAAINTYGCSFKLTAMCILQSRLLKADRHFAKLDARCTEPDEWQLIRELIIFSNRCVVCLHVIYWVYSGSTGVAAVFNGSPPFQIYNPLWHWRDSTRNLILQGIAEVVLLDFACFQEVSMDSYPIIYINIIRTHIKILKNRIARLGQNKKLNNDERYEELIKCIIDHKNILKLLDDVSPVISTTIFIQFLIMGCIFGVTFVNILIFSSPSEMIGSFAYILSVTMETFPCCFFASCLMEESDEIANSIFHSNWADEDERFKQVIAYFLQQTQKTITLTAGKIFPITTNSNINLAKFAFSVYTFVTQIDLAAKFKKGHDVVDIEDSEFLQIIGGD